MRSPQRRPAFPLLCDRGDNFCSSRTSAHCPYLAGGVGWSKEYKKFVNNLWTPVSGTPPARLPCAADVCVTMMARVRGVSKASKSTGLGLYLVGRTDDSRLSSR